MTLNLGVTYAAPAIGTIWSATANGTPLDPALLQLPGDNLSHGAGDGRDRPPSPGRPGSAIRA